MRPRKIEKLSATLDKLLTARGMGSRIKEYRVFGQWEKIVGAVVARHTQPVSLRGRKLTVLVDSSAWMQQLSLLKPEIVEKVNRGLGKEAVQGITLRIGEVLSSARKSLEQPLSGSLTPGEQERIEQYTRDIADPGIREAIRHVMEKDFLNKKRKRNKG